MANAEHGGPGGAFGTSPDTKMAAVRVGLWLIAAALAVRQVAAVLTTPRGERLTDRRAYPRGDAADRLSRAEIVAKFRESADGLLHKSKTEQAVEMIIGLAELPDVADLCATLSASPGARI